jgi:hypothetical protein
VDRSPLVQALAARAGEPGPLLVGGPPGAGKTTLLREVAESLASTGWLPISLDLMGAASSPERFVAAALAALPAGSFAARLAEATTIRRLADQGKKGGAPAVEALLALWSSLDEAGGRPVALLFDEATEIRSLAYFAGLREVDRLFGRALSRRRRATILATSYPTQARRAWPDWETFTVPRLEAAELSPLARRAGADADALARACCGLPRYLQALWDALEAGARPEDAWAAEMRLGGRLEEGARHTYEALLLRSRGYGMSKALLGVVAEDEGLNLTALVRRIGRSPGAVRDYLGWLLGVDVLRVERKRYFYVDGIVRWWVRLHGRGVAARDEEIAAAARDLLAGREPGVAPSRDSLTTAEPADTPVLVPPARVDTLIEID